MKILKYRILPFLMIFIILFACMNIQPPKAKAEVVSESLDDLVVLTAAGGAFTVAAPYVLVLGVTYVILGGIAENKEQIDANVAGFFYWCTDKGLDWASMWNAEFNKITLKEQGIAYYKQYLVTCQLAKDTIQTSNIVSSITLNKTNWSVYTIMPAITSYPFYFDVHYNDNYNVFEFQMGAKSASYWTNMFSLYTLQSSKVGTIYAGKTYQLSVPSPGTMRFKVDLLGGVPQLYNYLTNSLITPFNIPVDSNFVIGTYSSSTLNTTQSVVISIPFNPSEVNTVGNLVDVGTNPTSRNPFFPLNGDITVDVPEGAIPSTQVVGQTATTVTEVNTVATTGVVNPSLSDPISNSAGINFNPLLMVFKDKFPFCIPFDLIGMFSGLFAVRKAPKFTITFPSQFFVGGGSFDLDFSYFESIVLILRYMELFGFTIWLITITREKMVKG